MRPRYELRHDSDGFWSVIDIFTSKPALVDGVRLIHKEVGEAGALVARLNGLESKSLPAKR